jgi:hypothetical protein
MRKEMFMENYEKVILTDADGVLFNWKYAFDIYAEKRGYVMVDKNVYDIAECYGIEKKEAKRLVRDFNESAAIGYLPPLRDAIHYVKNAQRLRTMNLKKLFGETVFEKFTYLDTGADKDEVLAKYEGKDYLWIEDKVENALEGAKVGLEGCVMKHGFNIHDIEPNGLTGFANWKEIYEYLK